MKTKGFTLLELLIVIVIIGIMAAFALPAYFRAAEKARAGEGASVLGTLRSAQIRYAAEHGDYAQPGQIGLLDVSLTPGKYFTFDLIDADPIGGGTNEPIAEATRNAFQKMFDDYTLKIEEDGDINCEPAGSGCVAAGY